MTQLDTKEHAYYGGCIKCNARTSNRTGMCAPCRTQECIKCKLPFMPKIPSKVCGYCRSKKRRAAP